MTLTASCPWPLGGGLELRRYRRVAIGIGFHPFAVFAVLLQLQALAVSQQLSADWQQQLRDQANTQQLDAAMATVERRLAENPADLEAHGWRGRVLAWKGRWGEAEAEYRLVLAQAPTDIDVLTGLADVLVWQQKLPEAEETLEKACSLSPSDPEILLRRARVLLLAGRTAEARAQYRQILAFDPSNEKARRGLAALAGEPRHELRAGVDVDSFNYTDTAAAQSLTFSSRWNRRWSTVLGTSLYQGFGEHAGKLAGSAAYGFTARDWLSAGGAAADDQGVIPKGETFFEYGHAFRFRNAWIRGLEASYQQRWLWYRAAHVLTLNATQIYYFPKEWTWSFSLTGARSGFAGTGVEWVPAGSAKLGFPLYQGLSGSVWFAVGSENFSQADQIGRFAARTFGGGLRYRLNARQDIGGYVAVQNRSQGRAQNSFGLNYGFRF